MSELIYAKPKIIKPTKGLKMIGKMTAILKKADGSKEIYVHNNLITQVGFDFIANAIGKSSSRPDVMSYIAVGTGTTAADVADTTLETEIARAAATYAHVTGEMTFEFQADFGAGVGTGAITEAGVLNAASSGILFDRVVFAAINKLAGDSLTQKFEFTMA